MENELLFQLGINWKLFLSQAINFFILLVVLTFFVYKPLIKVIKERNQKIKTGLDKAEEATARLKEIDNIGKEKIKEAEQKGIEMIKETENRAKILDKENIEKLEKKQKEAQEIEKIYSKMEAGTTEDVTKHIFNQSYIIINPFEWTDMGTWGVIDEFLSEEKKNYIDGNAITVDTKNSFIKGNKNKLIATIGLDNILVVDTDDALLICPKNRAQDVKKIVDELKKNKDKKYL